MPRMHIATAFALIALLAAHAPRDLPDRVEIRRTQYGVPHLLAEDLEALGFGLAWVQSEDYGGRVAHGLVRARGHLARYFGRDSLESDFAFRQSHARAAATWGRLEPDTRAVFRGFAEGVNAYVERHRDAFPDWMPRDFTGPDVAALWMEPVLPGDALRFRRRRAAERADSLRRLGAGSNAWALAPGRTRSGRAILLRNPHLDWSAGYYEAHVTVPGVLNFYGDFRIGYPVFLNGGFNPHLGFATTNNDTDLEQFYVLTLDPARPDHYRFDGASVPLERYEVSVEVRRGAGLTTETREFWRTPLGPVLERDAGQAVIARWPADGEFRKGEQFLRMMRARTLEEWKAAMRLRAHTTSNLIYADREGNIFYVWNATIPRLPHPSGGDTAAIPAAGRADLWTQVVPFEELPQLLNPPTGYVQNSNDPFHYTNLDVVLDSAAFPAHYPRPALGLRSQLGLALVTGARNVSLEDVVRLKHSHRMLAGERFRDDLLAAVRDAAPAGAVAEAARMLARWDGTAAPGARGAVLFEVWFRRYLDGDSAASGLPFDARWRAAFAEPWDPARPVTTPDGLADPARAARDFAWAVEETARRFGRADVAWGEVHRVRRGNVDVPVGGCHGLLGCFRVLWFEDAPGGRRVVRGGDGWVLAVEFGRQPRAYSVLGYGQSDRLDSPHHADQAGMFARGQMKRVAFTERDIARTLIRRYRPAR
jgi:acyl-homoserine-lactone acylase